MRLENRSLVLAAITLTFLFAASPLALPSLAFSASPSAAAAGTVTLSLSNNSCGVTISQENHANDAIQLALDAAARSKTSPVTVCVGHGIFPEQLNITSRGGISLIGLGTQNNPTVIDPTSVVVNNLDTILNCCTFAQAAIILVGNNGTGATISSVNIMNLVINGNGGRASIDNYPLCYADYAGINYDGASGSIKNNLIENMYMPLDQNNCGDGGGIDVDINNNLSPAETVAVSNNFIPNYGEFGIGCWGPKQTCLITNNQVTFYSKYSPTTAPSGIAILGGALASVSHNLASGNICTDKPLCGSNLITQYQASGIFTSGSAAGTELSYNTLVHNDIGVIVSGDTTSVLHNRISESRVAGVAAEDGLGTYKIADNNLWQNPVGVGVVNEGYVLSDCTPFTAKLISNSFNHVPIQLEILTLTPGSAIVHFSGETYDVSGNSTVIVT